MPGFREPDKFTRRLDYLGSLLTALKAGHKPLLNETDPFDAAFISLLENMGAQGDLDAPASFHYTAPSDDAASIATKLKVSTGSANIRVLRGDLQRERTALLESLAENHVPNAQILGAHFIPERRADNYVLSSRGGLDALRETVALLRDVLARRGRKPGPGDQPLALVVENGSDRWTPLLTLLGLESEAAQKNFNRRFVSGRHNFHLAVADGAEEVAAIILHEGNAPTRKIAEPRNIFKPGTQILPFATGNQPKEHDAPIIAATHHLNVEIPHSNVVGGHSENSDEFTGTFVANAADKSLTTVRAKLAGPGGVVNDALSKLATDRAHTKIVSSDGGGAVSSRLFAEKEFDGVRGLIPEGMPTPGVENKSVVQYFGTAADYYGLLNLVRDRLDPLHEDAELGRIIDTCTWAMVGLDPDNPSAPVCYVYEDKAVNTLGPARPAADRVKEDKHYLYPDWAEGQTIAELEAAGDPRVWAQTAFAKSLVGLLEESGAEKGEPGLRREFNRRAQGPLKILLNTQLDARSLSNDLREQIDAAIRPHGMEVMKDVLLPTNLIEHRALMQRADGFVVLKDDGIDPVVDARFQDDVFVGKQIRDPLFETKPLLYLCDGDDDRGPNTRAIDHGTRAGMIAESQDRLCKRPTSIDALVGDLVQAFAHYARPVAPPQRALPPVPFRRGKDRFIIFCSASTAIPRALDKPHALSYNCGVNDIDVTDGGGRHSGMGQAKYGYLKAQAEQRRAGQSPQGMTIGVQDPYTVITEGSPKEFLPPEHFLVANHINQREVLMMQLEKIIAEQQNDGPVGQTFVVLFDGGIGSQKEKLDMLWEAKMALETKLAKSLSNLHFIICNEPRELVDGTQAGPYDVFIENLPDSYLSRLDVKFCENEQEVWDIYCKTTGQDIPWRDVSRGDAGYYPFDAEKNGQLAELDARPYLSPAREDRPGLRL